MLSIFDVVAPILTSLNDTSVLVLVNQLLLLKFSITQASPPVRLDDIEWFFSNLSYRPLLVSDKVQLSPDRLGLFVENVSTVNGGRYLVSVSNPAGRDEATVAVTVEGTLYLKIYSKSHTHCVIDSFTNSLDHSVFIYY